MIRLSWAEREVSAIAKSAGGRAYCGGRATERAFKREARKAGILHIATHCVVDPDNPAYTRLILSPESGSGEDGSLNLYEIYDMRLSANLAVLDACETGTGILAPGEGFLSAGRCFMVAGCPAVLMSLWPVDDRAGFDLMTGYYKGLSAGMRKHEALRSAKLAYLETADGRRASPVFWAAFAQAGSLDPIAVGAKRSGLRPAALAAACATAAAVLAGVLLRTRRRGAARKRRPRR